ncbi:hypothetical protein CBM2599_A10298 [Cupriavidus taiwanensis]|nr:hypothetical protein CBM2599_A10298 [Cupriavidus taiwanensis]SOY80486.1 hypothetical protein CBM2600_A10143 [Cupriavidus taiwanensis]
MEELNSQALPGTLAHAQSDLQPFTGPIRYVITHFGSVITRFGIVITDLAGITAVIRFRRNKGSASRRNR